MLTAMLLGLGLNPGEGMDVCKCIMPSRHGGTINSCRAASPLLRLMEGEKRSELIAISGALDNALNSYKDSIWILTHSRSSIQYLKNWPKIMDCTGLDI
ncbi:hypothetical protein TNCV_3366091 [Trichonephila clavipes]|nr:hypothetical protein TNCV_3366091 [Trichonephila clavipes]